MPVIALHSGAKLEEICQLHLADIRQEDGVWVFDINNQAGKAIIGATSITQLDELASYFDLTLPAQALTGIAAVHRAYPSPTTL